MAVTWGAKPPGAVYRYTWTPPLADGDGLASISLSISGATIDDSEIVDNAAVIWISAGTAGTTAIVTATGISDDGEEFAETIYLPIRATTALLGNTARDIVAFALSKIVGDEEDPSAAQLTGALERLNDMLMMWRMDGLDIGLPGVLAADDALTVADEYIAAIKFNLRIACHSHYGAPIDPLDASMATEGKRLIANRLLSFDDLTMSTTLARRTIYG